MTRTTGHRHHSDAELAAGAGSGDREAFAVLYERYFRRLFDFTLRTVRDHHLAGDVVQTTFVKAWEKLRAGQPVRHVKAWLFTIARNAAIDELRRRRRLVSAPSEEDTPQFAEIDLDRWADPELVLRDRELVEMVWSAAQALGRDEYTLLDLHLRQQLTADELADALLLQKGAVYTRLSRLRGALEAAVTVQVLARRGREGCPELAALLHEAETADLTPELRRTVERHVADCPICEERKRRLLAPAEIFAGLAPIAVDGELRRSIWERVQDGIDADARRHRAPPRRRPWALTGSILVALLAAAAVLFAMWARPAPLAEDPGDVHSPSHQVGVASTAAVVTVQWTPPTTATGYSVTWSERPVDLPDEVVDLAGDAAGTESPPLLPGDWYFHLRTRGRGGDWTATVHLGPFLIRGPQETGAPAPSPSTTSSSTVPASTTTATTTTTTTTITTTTTLPPSTTPPTTSPPPTRPR